MEQNDLHLALVIVDP